MNVTCSNQTQLVYVWDKRYVYLYTSVYMTKFVIELVIAVTYQSLSFFSLKYKGRGIC